MADWGNDATLAVRKSSDPSPTTGWTQITRAQAEAAELISQQYRKGTWPASVVEMNQGEKDVVDAAAAQASADAASSSADDSAGLSNEDVWQGFREIVESLTKTHNKLANRIREIERALDDVKNSAGGSANIRAAIPLPSAEVISEGSAPATFTNLQNRTKAQEMADFRQDLRDKNGQV